MLNPCTGQWDEFFKVRIGWIEMLITSRTAEDYRVKSVFCRTFSPKYIGLRRLCLECPSRCRDNMLLDPEPGLLIKLYPKRDELREHDDGSRLAR